MKNLLYIGIGAVVGAGTTYAYWRKRYSEVVENSKELAMYAWKMSREIYNSEIEHIKKYGIENKNINNEKHYN